MKPHEVSPEWAIETLDRIITSDNPDQLEALLELIAGIAPTKEQDKYKNDAARAAIQHGYRKSRDCDQACEKYLGVAV